MERRLDIIEGLALIRTREPSRKIIESHRRRYFVHEFHADRLGESPEMLGSGLADRLVLGGGFEGVGEFEAFPAVFVRDRRGEIFGGAGAGGDFETDHGGGGALVEARGAVFGHKFGFEGARLAEIGGAEVDGLGGVLERAVGAGDDGSKITVPIPVFASLPEGHDQLMPGGKK